MARFAGTEIPNDKRIEVGLTYIYGIGPTLAKKILAATSLWSAMIKLDVMIL